MIFICKKFCGNPSKYSGLSITVCLLAASVRTAYGAETIDKSAYSLANPTPDAHLREMTTDRPDITEVPFTIDPGRFQIETTAVGFTRSRPDPDGAVTRGYEFVASNIRVGLTKDLEATVMVLPYGQQRTSRPYADTNQAGIGAVVLRAKYNLWGNDTYGKTQSTALAVLPYISLPTDRQNGISPQSIDGGFQTFFAADLGNQFSLGINIGLHAIKSESETGHHVEATGSATLGYQWSEKFTTYVEIAARGGTKDPLGDVILLGGGLAYKVSPNLQIDAGINFGATPASPSISPFVGLSSRF